MNKVSDYLKHAAECRVLANRARSADERVMIMKMAVTWEELPEARKLKLQKNGDGKRVDVVEGVSADYCHDQPNPRLSAHRVH